MVLPCLRNFTTTRTFVLSISFVEQAFLAVWFNEHWERLHELFDCSLGQGLFLIAQLDAYICSLKFGNVNLMGQPLRPFVSRVLQCIMNVRDISVPRSHPSLLP